MPIIHYWCECQYSTSKFFRSAKEAPTLIKCLKCSGEAKKQLSAPNSRSIVTVDNGVQARSVDVDLTLVEDIKDRSTKDFKDKP